MSEDYYKTLGLKRNATPEEIQKAYRELARKHHPDMNPGDEKAKARFQDVQKAYEVLYDPEKRKLYDRYGSSFEAFQQGGGGPREPAGGFRGPGGQNVRYEDIDLGDLFGGGGGGPGGGAGGFADFFRQFTQAPGGGPGDAPRGASGRPPGDLHEELKVPLATAVLGGEAQIRVAQPDGKLQSIQVKIPAGIESGKKIRVRGQGRTSAAGRRGDIIITVRVAPHPHFQRQGRDLVVRVPLSISEAVLGAKVDVPTPQGEITLSVPPGTSSGKRLRIKGHGVRPARGEPGDLYAEVQIVVPDDVSPQDAELLKRIDSRSPRELRGSIRW